MKCDLFIPVWNIKERGFERLWMLLYSCRLQHDAEFHRIWICDGSHPKQAEEIEKICKMAEEKLSLKIIHAHSHQSKFNKPKLINTCAKLSDAEFFIFSDCDYIFSHDLLAETKMMWDKDSFLIKESRNLNYIAAKGINEDSVWQWSQLASKSEPNGFPVRVACGAWQVHTREFFRYSGGLNEKMSGMSGMDEEYLKRAEMHGLKIREIEGGQLLHQYHRPLKGAKPTPDQQRNWRLLHHCFSVIQNND